MSKFLCTHIPIFIKRIIYIRQYFCHTMSNIYHIQETFNPYMFAHHIFMDRPECFMFIVIGFNRPTKFIQFQRIKNASSTGQFLNSEFSCHAHDICSSAADTVQKNNRCEPFEFDVTYAWTERLPKRFILTIRWVTLYVPNFISKILDEINMKFISKFF